MWPWRFDLLKVKVNVDSYSASGSHCHTVQKHYWRRSELCTPSSAQPLVLYAWVLRWSASVILPVCLHDKTETAKTKIAKLGTEIVRHDISPTSEYYRSKVNQRLGLVDRVAGASNASLLSAPLVFFNAVASMFVILLVISDVFLCVFLVIMSSVISISAIDCLTSCSQKDWRT